MKSLFRQAIQYGGWGVIVFYCMMGWAMAIEEPQFKVLRAEESMALREYAPYIVAETLVDSRFEDASSEGFRRLAGYIFGGNQGSKKVAMTAPVVQSEGEGQKIAMTSPVGLEKASETQWRITFSMPSEYTLATLPKPNDARVSLRELPAHWIAAYEYSGTWSQERFEEKKQALLEWIKKNGWKPCGAPMLARYNPPWTPWFLRRNEVLIPVEKTP
ncbi:MAG: SOUL family heme-binding protein [Bdellovibrionia bacterium]